MLIGMDDIGMIAGQGEDFATSTRTSPRRSTPTDRVEVITRGARRRWSAEEKQSIVLESLAPGAVISEICRRHEISSGQFCTWRRQLRDGRLAGGIVPVPAFARAVVAEPAAAGPVPPSIVSSAPAPSEAADRPAPRRRRSRGASRADEQIAIALPDGAVVRVGPSVDQSALARVLMALKNA
jgi:transposase